MLFFCWTRQSIQWTEELFLLNLERINSLMTTYWLPSKSGISHAEISLKLIRSDANFISRKRETRRSQTKGWMTEVLSHDYAATQYAEISRWNLCGGEDNENSFLFALHFSFCCDSFRSPTILMTNESKHESQDSTFTWNLNDYSPQY